MGCIELWGEVVGLAISDLYNRREKVGAMAFLVGGYVDQTDIGQMVIYARKIHAMDILSSWRNIDQMRLQYAENTLLLAMLRSSMRDDRKSRDTEALQFSNLTPTIFSLAKKNLLKKRSISHARKMINTQFVSATSVNLGAALAKIENLCNKTGLRRPRRDSHATE